MERGEARRCCVATGRTCEGDASFRETEDVSLRDARSMKNGYARARARAAALMCIRVSMRGVNEGARKRSPQRHRRRGRCCRLVSSIRYRAHLLSFFLSPFL